MNSDFFGLAVVFLILSVILFLIWKNGPKGPRGSKVLDPFIEKIIGAAMA